MFPKRHPNLYKTLRNQLTGGLSIVFCRYAAAGKTQIRNHEISNPETTEKILGLDANSLYLHAIAQNNPTGYFCRYKESENYRPDFCSRYGLMAYQWLCLMQGKERNFIQSRYNMGERFVAKYSYKVDGFCEETNTVYEFEGCFWYGCDACNVNRNADGSLREIHPIKNIPFSQIREATWEKKQALTAEGSRVVSIRECEWLRMRKQFEIVSFLKTLKCVLPKHQLSFEKIVKGIKNKELFGFLIVDIHTLEDLKYFCRDFPPIIMSINISREDISVYMQKVAEQHDLLKKPKKYLISSYFEKEILINMEMAEFYLNLGLKIIRMYKFIQFHPEKCFETLANEIVNSRKEANLDKSKTVIALTNKLTGNSLYSASLLNKEKHRNITYPSKDTINKTINDPHFVHLDEIISDLYEVKSLKQNIRYDLPIQIGLNVYLNSKLHMFKFFYCFLRSTYLNVVLSF